MGGNRYADVIGFHFYAGHLPPESTLRAIEGVREIMRENGLSNLELWNTESGWTIVNEQPWRHGYGNAHVLQTEEAAAFVMRSYLLFWSSGVTRSYWYAWGHMTMGLSEVDAKTPKLAAEAYTAIQQWTRDATLLECSQSVDQAWVCSLEWNSGVRAWIIWTTEEASLFEIPKSWPVRSIKTLNQGDSCLEGAPKHIIAISGTPRILTSDTISCPPVAPYNISEDVSSD